LLSARFGWRTGREKGQHLDQLWLPYPHEKGNKWERGFCQLFGGNSLEIVNQVCVFETTNLKEVKKWED
jgi:hypothetical protein